MDKEINIINYFIKYRSNVMLFNIVFGIVVAFFLFLVTANYFYLEDRLPFYIFWILCSCVYIASFIMSVEATEEGLRINRLLWPSRGISWDEITRMYIRNVNKLVVAYGDDIFEWVYIPVESFGPGWRAKKLMQIIAEKAELNVKRKTFWGRTIYERQL